MARIAAVAGITVLVLIALYVRFGIEDRDSGPRERIALVLQTGETRNLWAMDVDGSNARQLTFLSGAGDYGPPAWSPDGREIIFSAAGDVYLIGADGSNRRQLTRTSESESWPQFVDAGRVAYWTNGRPFALSLRDSSIKPLGASVPEGQLSPDAEQVAIHFDPNQGRTVAQARIVDVKIGKGRPLTEEVAYTAHPAWSPDGQKVAFSCAERPPHVGPRSVVPTSAPDPSGICVARADGTDVVRITDRVSGQPAWSPDGERMAVVGVNLHIVEVATGKVSQVTRCNCAHGYPAWSPR